MSEQSDVINLATKWQLNTSRPDDEKYILFTEKVFRDKLVLLRHAERLDHVDRTWRGNDGLASTDPPLSNDGRNQCFETALRYCWKYRQKKIEHRLEGLISYIITSPYHRCVETAIIINIIAFQGKCALFVDPLLSDWGQKKVYRNSPILSGEFQEWEVKRLKNCKVKRRIIYAINYEAILRTFIPFLESKAIKESVNNEELYTARDVKEWIRITHKWVSQHHSLPVWSDSNTLERLLSCGEVDKNHNDNDIYIRKQWSNHSNTLKVQQMIRRCKKLFFPESRNDFMKRCSQFVEVHYQGAIANKCESYSVMPMNVVNALTKEQKIEIPKYFQSYHELNRELQHCMGKPALMSATHVLAVTHADVISTLIEVCSPRYFLRNTGIAVPSCSRTVLERTNNYYRVPSMEERSK